MASGPGGHAVLIAAALFLFTAFPAVGSKPAPPDPGSPVYEAIKRGDRAEALRLIKVGAGVDAVSGQGYTPLALAIRNGDIEMVMALLDRGADPHRALRLGGNALRLAAQSGSYALVTLFHKMGVDPDPDSPGYQSALSAAICSGQRGDRDRIVELLLPLTNLARERPELHGSLGCAARTGPVDLVKKLLSLGARIPTGPFSGPILTVSRDLEVIKVLVEHGADIRAANVSGSTVLHHFAGLDVEIVRYLLAKGADIQARDNAGRTPLFRAATFTDKSMIELMLAHGADPEVRDSAGAGVLFVTPPYLVESIQVLLKRGADPRIRTETGATALHAYASAYYGTRKRGWEGVRLLVEAGADINAVDSKGSTPLRFAARTVDPDAIDAFLKAGANPRLADNEGVTPLHQVAMFRIERHPPGPAGWPVPPGENVPYILAQIARKKEALELLIRAGADKSARDNRNRRALDLIGASEHEEPLRRVLQ